MAGVAFFDIDRFQLEEGVVATEYERPAPAPDYPIEIHSLNDFDVVSQKSEGGIIDGIEVGGRNLWVDSTTEGSFDKWGAGDGTKTLDTTFLWNNKPTIKFVKGSSSSGGLSNNNIRDKLPPNSKFTYSFMIYSSVPISPHNNLLTHMQLVGTSEPISVHRERNMVYKPTTIPANKWTKVSVTFETPDAITPGETFSFRSYLWYLPNGATFYFADFMLEFGNKASDWTPAPEDISESDNHPLIDKINLLLDEPLRSVGDVKDRLFRDSDGLWKVNRKIGEYLVDGSRAPTVESRLSNGFIQAHLSYADLGRSYNDNVGLSSHFNVINPAEATTTSHHGEGINLRNSYSVMRFKLDAQKRFKKSVAEVTNSDVKDWLTNNNITIHYIKGEPITETLSKPLQDKLNNLRSFKDSNYIYTVLPGKSNILSENLEPTLHATFKSVAWANDFRYQEVQSSIEGKADSSATEAALNEAAAKLQVLQQELEAAATADELKDFVAQYNNEQEALNADKATSEKSLSDAMMSIDAITTNMGEMSQTWKFVDRSIRNTPQGIVIGNESSGSYIRINEEEIGFFSNGQRVAFVAQSVMQIDKGIFVEEIKVAKYQFQESTNNHLTIRFVG